VFYVSFTAITAASIDAYCQLMQNSMVNFDCIWSLFCDVYGPFRYSYLFYIIIQLVPITLENIYYGLKLGCHVLSLIFSLTRLVLFDSCLRLESAFRPKTSICDRHSGRLP